MSDFQAVILKISCSNFNPNLAIIKEKNRVKTARNGFYSHTEPSTFVPTNKYKIINNLKKWKIKKQKKS